MLNKKQARSALVVIGKVKKLLGPKGENWTKGIYHNPKTDKYCLMGAFRKVTKSNRIHSGVLAVREANDLSEDSFFNEDNGIIDVNDLKSTRFTTIKSMLNKAEQYAKARA